MPRQTPLSQTLATEGAGAARPHPEHGLWRTLVRHRTAYLLIAPTLLCLLVVIGYPIVRIFVESLYSVEPVKHAGWRFIGLDNYVDLFQDAEFWASAFRTLIWTVTSVLCQFILGLSVALVLRETFRGRGLLRALFLLPWATPAVIGAMAWKWMYQGQYGLINATLRLVGLDINTAWLGDPNTALPAVIITNIWRGFPYVMLTLLAAILVIPRDYYEAAAVDGATYWQAQRRITLPLIRPAITVATLLSGIWTFNNFSYIYVLTGGGPAGRTDIMVTYVYKNAFQFFHFGYASALSVVLFVIVLVLSTLYIVFVGRDSLR